MYLLLPLQFLITAKISLSFAFKQRHSALLLQCNGFAEMDTGRILQVLSEAFDSAVEPIEKPVGLEWVDDSTVVILWSSECKIDFLTCLISHLAYILSLQSGHDKHFYIFLPPFSTKITLWNLYLVLLVTMKPQLD